MIYEVEVSEQADSDLRGIFEYIAFELQWLNEKVTSTGLIMKPAPEMDLAVTFSRVMA